jgi:hypothetical protein
MSRLTGSDALGLYEAYQAVYNPQELTEEQVWEEVETWVNTLIEEGYDLSDYTWEEMFEAYLEEQGGTRGGGERATSQQVGAINRGLSSFGQSIGQSMAAANKVPTSSGSRNVRGGGSRPATPAAKPSTTPAAKPTATPAAATATPAAPAPAARPAAPAPAARPAAKPAASTAPAAKPAAMDQWAKANPRLAQAQQIRKQGGSRAEVNKSLYNKGTAAATSTPTVVKAGFDMFDVVKGYLIGEGYADTEEAALAIMINMSEEWRESIVEERAPGVKPYKAGPTQAEVRADAKRASKKKTEKDKDKEGYGPEEKFKDWKLTSTPSTVSKTGETISQRMDKEAPYKTRPFSPLFTKQGSRTASAVTRATEGPGEPQSVTMPRKKSKPSREIVRKRKDTNESYDYILSHLIYEGYANTQESAEKIILNMSEDWILSIIQ